MARPHRLAAQGHDHRIAQRGDGDRGAGRQHRHAAGLDALAIHFHFAAGDVDRALAVLGGQRHARTGTQLPVHVELWRVDPHRRLHARQTAGDQTPAGAIAIEHRQHVAGVVPEARLHFLAPVGQRHPGLDTIEPAALRAQLLEALGMRDAAAGSHPVDLAGAHRLLRTDTVAVHDLACEQIGDGRQADVRMRTHIGLARQTGRKVLGAHTIEKDVGPDHAALGERQHAADLEAAKVPVALLDDEFDHGCPPRCLGILTFSRPTADGHQRSRLSRAVAGQ